jgi:hypothetical protein
MINNKPIKNSKPINKRAIIGAAYQLAIPISTNVNSKVSITGKSLV